MSNKTKSQQRQQLKYRLKKLTINKLKGVENCSIFFPETKKVTAIMGMNGSGKSTILHAIACCYKPIGVTSKDNNRFSDFFTPHIGNQWKDSCFTIDFYSGILSNLGSRIIFTPADGALSNYTQKYSKNKRWMPIYERRPEKQSIYIGLQNLGTFSDDLTAAKYAKYEIVDFEPMDLKLKILTSMSKIMGVNYSELYNCLTERNSKTFLGVVKNGISYTEHTMGAGEKRVFDIVRACHDTTLRPNGLLLIDELDVLLHEKAFTRLIEELITISENNLLEIIFTTHRESVINFKNKINIVSIYNMGNGIEAYPGVSADALRQLTDIEPEMVSIFVEDNLARTIINVILERAALHDKVDVALFGASDNSAVVLSGLILAGKDISRSICVLDGDVFITQAEKTAMVNKYLTGTDKRIEKEIVLNRIFQFNLENKAIEGQKGMPEYNHKVWFEAIDENLIPENERQEFIKLRNYSNSIQGLNDWHEYYADLNRYARKPDIEYTIINYISKYHPYWDIYTNDIKIEIERIVEQLN